MRFVPTGKVKFSALLIPLVIIVAIICQSCGTAHHFMPHRPLDKGEWQLSFYWHYDFDGMDSPNILPDLNSYVGVGNNNNLGFGAIVPGFPSHVTFVKYEPLKNDARWAYYFHINRVLSPHDNPYFEGGTSLIKKTSGNAQIMSFGLSYGHGNGLPFLGIFKGKGHFKNSRIIPVLKYAYTGTDLGLSISHYHGLSRSEFAPLKDAALNENDTLVVLDSKNVDSVSLISKSDFLGGRERWGIFLNEGETIYLVHKTIFYPDQFSSYYKRLQNWLGRDLKIFFFEIEEYEDKWKYGMSILNIEELKQKFASSDSVAITRYSNSLLRKINNINSWKADNSIGIALFDDPNN